MRRLRRWIAVRKAAISVARLGVKEGWNHQPVCSSLADIRAANAERRAAMSLENPVLMGAVMKERSAIVEKYGA